MDFMQYIYMFFASTADVWYWVTMFCAIALILFGLDDILMDLYYWYKFIFHRKKWSPHRYTDADSLTLTVEKPIAILIPTWKEQDVIGKMIDNIIDTVRYTNYHIFVGIYSNDQDTLSAVMDLESQYDNVHAIVDGEGPTTKADNMNKLYEGLKAWEQEFGIHFEILALHDAEDVIHEDELLVYNYYMQTEEYDMIQLPVFPLEMEKSKFIHWTYNDEFAEVHTKDVEVRANVSGLVPSAGTATAYSRSALEKYFGDELVFDTKSLTEDYESALRLAMKGAKMGFIYLPAKKEVALGSYFPETFKTAVRQRTRWNVGIIFQAWKTFGWRGSPLFNWKRNLALRYYMYRDRRAVAGNIVNMIAYLSFIYIILHELMEAGIFKYEIPPIVHEYTLIWYLVAIATTMMLSFAIAR